MRSTRFAKHERPAGPGPRSPPRWRSVLRLCINVTQPDSAALNHLSHRPGWLVAARLRAFGNAFDELLVGDPRSAILALWAHAGRSGRRFNSTPNPPCCMYQITS